MSYWEMEKTVWFDFTNVPHVSFLSPLITLLEDKYKTIFSLRDFAETEGLFRKKINKPYLKAGKHKGNSKISKIIGVFERSYLLNKMLPEFDLKISVGGDASNLITKWRGKKSITFDDNETAPNWRYSHFSDYAFWPMAVVVEKLLKQGFTRRKLYQYNGFMEDIYLANYFPDSSFVNKLPFKNYVVVRPENIQANYVNSKLNSIVPALLDRFNQERINVLFLPRYKEDRRYAEGFKNIFVPDEAIDGLDACFFSDAVITGAGTMAREAACMGVPAVSFYSGKNLLSVDKKMIELEWLLFSRDVNEIYNYLKRVKKDYKGLERSKNVWREVEGKFSEVISQFGI
jgi:predicted glycosyltransferase